MEPDVNQHQQENKSAFEALFKQYYPILSAFAYRFVKDEDLSKDIVQNVFVKLYSILSSLEIQSTIQSYLYKAVYNECLSELRKSEVRKRHSQVYAESMDTAYFDHAVEQNEREKAVYLAIDSLPSRCKEVFILSRVHGKKNHEIAEELGLSSRTVETQISLALKKLRKSLLLWLLFFH